MRENLTFGNGLPSWGVACVGESGDLSYFNLAKGYSIAANLLIEKVIGSNVPDFNYRESLVYPICFNMRHSVELGLKALIFDLEKLPRDKQISPKFDLRKTHDIGKIWSDIRSDFIKFDKRYSPVIKEIDPYIQDILEVDATGQAFRYPESNSRESLLGKMPLISIHRLSSRFSKLEELLDELNHRNTSLLEEYSYGSYTKTLSRADLFKLAKALPPRPTWENNRFKSLPNRKFECHQSLRGEVGYHAS